VDFSLRVAWNNPPMGTRSFALIGEDPDAPSGSWIHWVIYDLSAATRALPENVPGERAKGTTTSARSDTMDPVRQEVHFTATFSGFMPWMQS
jgi:Raf kinase inhibitor-like YbhB/YbcL family protein